MPPRPVSGEDDADGVASLMRWRPDDTVWATTMAVLAPGAWLAATADIVLAAALVAFAAPVGLVLGVTWATSLAQARCVPKREQRLLLIEALGLFVMPNEEEKVRELGRLLQDRRELKLARFPAWLVLITEPLAAYRVVRDEQAVRLARRRAEERPPRRQRSRSRSPTVRP